MFCAGCGSERKGLEPYCVGCGSEFSDSEPDNALADTTSSNDPDSSRSFLTRTKSIVNKVIAGIGILVLAILLLVALLAIFVGSCLPPSSTGKDVVSGRVPIQQSPPTPIPMPTPTPIGYVDLEEMLNLYKANDVAAEHRYEGKRIVIDGIIHEINKGYFDIIPHGSDWFQMSGARCYFHPDRFSDALALRKDQHITIRGTHDGLDLDLFLTMIKVMNCDF
jgi:hypothetical protein